MEEKREPDIITPEPEPDRPEPDPEPAPEQRATAEPIGMTVPPLPSTLMRATGRRIE